ncbi:MAG: gliding motility protein GldL [Tannerellaceae bacterium]|nr:gliding motility protein GldL [Tannerellaceae bacterium]
MKTIIEQVQRTLSGKKRERFWHICYNWGAAVVLIGAMFKILHLPYANVLLIVAMTAEALIFFLSGFDYQDEPHEPDKQSAFTSTNPGRYRIDTCEQKIDQLSRQLNQINLFVSHMERNLQEMNMLYQSLSEELQRDQEQRETEDENDILI